MTSSLPGSSSRAWRRLDSSPAASSRESSLSASVGQQRLHEASDLLLGIGADEAVDHLAVPEGVHRRDRLHPERLADARVLVDVDLRQHDLAVGPLDHLLDDRPEGAAGAAPRRPQINDDGHFLRALHHFGVERGVGDIDRPWIQATGGRPGREPCAAGLRRPRAATLRSCGPSSARRRSAPSPAVRERWYRRGAVVDHRFVAEIPKLDAPVLVVMLTGWIDASGAAAAAMAASSRSATSPRSSSSTTTCTSITAPAGRSSSCATVSTIGSSGPRQRCNMVGTPSGRDVLHAQRSRARHGVAPLRLHDRRPGRRQLGVVRMAALGAYPFATPHTRPSHVSATSPSRDVLAALPFRTSSVDVPAGHGRGAGADGARAGHPGRRHLGPGSALRRVDVVPRGLRGAARGARPRRPAYASRPASCEGSRSSSASAWTSSSRATTSTSAMIAQFERLYDAADDAAATPVGGLELRSAEELADEVERLPPRAGQELTLASGHVAVEGEREQDRCGKRRDRADVVGAPSTPRRSAPSAAAAARRGRARRARCCGGRGSRSSARRSRGTAAGADHGVHGVRAHPSRAMPMTAAATEARPPCRTARA